MQLYDKDLLSMQEVRELIEGAKRAQQALSLCDQQTVDRIVKSIVGAGVRNARRLAELACEETGFGNVRDKIIKNIFASNGVYERIKDMRTIGEISRDDDKRTWTIASPIGVIAGLIPSTNPTSTALYKAIIAIKSGNAIVFSPHPSAQKCVLETVKVIRQAIAEARGDENLVSSITIPTIQATDALMKHQDTAMILATGGTAMVRAAYSSGTPAIGVGPGNGPAYIESTADIKKAVSRIIASKIFDNGTICASEQSVICDSCMESAVQAEMEKQGAYFLNGEEREKLGCFILRGNGTMNPMIVGKSVQTIAELAGLHIPAGAKVLVAREDGVGRGHPYSNEKLAPILAFYTAENYKEACKRCCEILYYEGAGHTFSIHTKDEKMVEYFAARIPASRIVVNTPSALGGIGASTGLMPALTLGCGALGGSATSDNVGPMNLVNLRKVAYGIKEIEEIRKEAPDYLEDISKTPDIDPSNIDIDTIVEKIIERLKTI